MTDQKQLFDPGEWWHDHWIDMPEFEQNDETPYESVRVHFRSKSDRNKFMAEMGYPAGRRSSIWYPTRDRISRSTQPDSFVNVKQNRWPLYVISKGRADRQLTCRYLSRLGLRHYLVVEPQEAEAYRSKGHGSELLVLPFSNLGHGSIPARNWVWNHAESSGELYHWILDDNLDGFYRLNNNAKVKIWTYNPFEIVERFVVRYKNIGLAGINYRFFASQDTALPPFYLNTRIYSCILVNHRLRHRWRGRYNEDTDLSIRALKDNWCTVLFNAVLVRKEPTMTMKGGNTDELYQAGGRKEMAESLERQHPDIVTTTWKWGRVQHHVDYSGFKQKLIFNDGRTDEEVERIRREHSEDGPAWMPALAEADWKAEEHLERAALPHGDD